jgi:hypothetical protein
MRSLRGIRGVAAVLALSALVFTASAEAGWHQRGTALEPRQQWNANFGYCGETSFIAVGMRHGQYTSQWTARRLASPGVPQWKQDAQLLLGVNDLAAARRMRLRAAEFDNRRQRSTRRFLSWGKRHFLRGHDVIIGVFNNVRKLGEPLSLADPEFDHIVPLMGFGSATPFGKSLAYRRTDVLTISDNGLYDIGPNVPFLYSYELGRFRKTRKQASASGGPLYSLKRRPPSYGVAVNGVADRERVTVPVRLTSPANGEGQQNGAKLEAPPQPRRIRLTAHATLPLEERAYNVYLYDSFADVPREHFNARAERAVRTWHVPAGHPRKWRTTIEALSSDTRVFRAVPASAT